MISLKLLLAPLLVAAVTSLPNPQGDDYPDDFWPVDDYGDTTTAKTTKATKTTTAKVTTTKATTISTGSGKKVKFPYLTSPVAGYKYTKVFGIHVFVNSKK